jgi:hypothetical protein
MARVPDLSVEDLAEADRDLLKRPIALHKALTNSPKAARAFSGLGQFIRYGSRLDPRLREWRSCKWAGRRVHLMNGRIT